LGLFPDFFLTLAEFPDISRFLEIQEVVTMLFFCDWLQYGSQNLVTSDSFSPHFVATYLSSCNSTTYFAF